jgi:hypothetical protein
MFIVRNFMCERVRSKSQDHIHDNLYECRQKNLFSRGQGAQTPPEVNVHKKGWLKQLKVAISTKASMPSKRKSTKFMKQILSTYTSRKL